MSLHRAAVLAAVKVWPGGVKTVSRSARRPTLTATRHDSYRERQVGAEGWSSIEQRDGTPEKDHAAAVRSPTRNSEEADLLVLGDKLAFE